MLEYTSRQVTQLIRQYEMFLKSLNILTSDFDKDKIYIQMNKIEEKILEETNTIYEEEYMLLLGSTTYLVNEEKERLLCLIKLIEDRIKYVKERRSKHKEATGYNVNYPEILGEDKIGEFKRNIRIIDKFNENKKKENQLSIEINELDANISEAVKKIKNNKNLNTTLEKKMINLLTKVFDKLELYKLTEEKDAIEQEYNELEYSLTKAKENVKKAKISGRDEIVIECDSLLSSITLEYEKFYMITIYTPNAKRELERLDYRMIWEDEVRKYLLKLNETKPVIVCGDLNVAHKEIDLKNPKTNRRNAGFTDEERGKMTELLDAGFIDSFRYLYPEKEEAYTWWSYMGRAREKNVGWRIDYFITSKDIEKNIKEASIYPEVYGSDHCPVGLEINI